MGFWNGLSKMVKGEPVFEVQSNESQNAVTSPDSQPQSRATDTREMSYDNQGHKIIPEITISRVESRVNGDKLEVWVTIQNNASTAVFLDKIQILGQKMELDFELASGTSRDMCVYKGIAPTTYNYRDADVYYRSVESGDYFQARFYVEYDSEANGIYLPNECKLQYPIRDI